MATGKMARMLAAFMDRASLPKYHLHVYLFEVLIGILQGADDPEKFSVDILLKSGIITPVLKKKDSGIV